MPTQRKPILHGADHLPGHADPIPGLTLGGGIQFDTDPQTGTYLWVRATGSGPHGNGIGFRTDDASGMDFYAAASGAEFALGAMSAYGVDVGLFSHGGMQLSNSAGGKLLLQNSSASDPLELNATGAGGIEIHSPSGTITMDTGGSLYASGYAWVQLATGSAYGGTKLELIEVTGVPILRLYTVNDTSAAPYFEIRNLGTSWEYHIKTGATWIADL